MVLIKSGPVEAQGCVRCGADGGPETAGCRYCGAIDRRLTAEQEERLAVLARDADARVSAGRDLYHGRIVGATSVPLGILLCVVIAESYDQASVELQALSVGGLLIVTLVVFGVALSIWDGRAIRRTFDTMVRGDVQQGLVLAGATWAQFDRIARAKVGPGAALIACLPDTSGD